MMSRLLSATLAGAIAFSGVAPAASGGEVSVGIAGGSLSVPVDSMKERKFTSVVRQRYDFSCGSAAIATLLSHHYGRKVNEEQAFEAMFTAGDQKAIQRYGFSLLDMKRYLAKLGLKADGFQITLDDLASVGIPAITLINTKGFKHFVVIKGLHDGRVLVGDPASGSKVFERAEFEAIWDRVLFVVRDEVEIAKASFNQPDEWRNHGRAPLDSAVNRMGFGSLLLPRSNEF